MDRHIRCKILVTITLVLSIFTTNLIYCYAEIDEPTKEPLRLQSSSQPLVIYYSRTGTTCTIAQELAKGLSCETEEVISRKNRHFFGTITCVFDQLFDRDDDIEPTKKDLSAYNPLIIASPVWIHRISSPVRTFLKHSEFKKKEAFLILTNNGNYDVEDESTIIQSAKSYGITTKGCYSICTRGKDKRELRQHATSIVKDIASVINK